ncbi:MAG: hypothetical protein HW421_1318, partial [Ignavibacteria bacterium]|nr:hypothetical protein [Ignavibacteria bacterium]
MKNKTNLTSFKLLIESSDYLKGVDMKTFLVIFLTMSLIPCMAGQNYKVEWVRSYGAVDGTLTPNLVCDSNRNVYVCGAFYSKSNFGNGISLSGSNQQDGFIARYNSNGVIKWAKLITGSYSYNYVTAAAIDINSNIWITGWFYGNLNADGYQLQSYGDNDVLISKLDSNGKILLFKQAGAKSSDGAWDIKMNNNNGFYICGGFTDNMNFGNGISLNGKHASTFFAAYDANNNCFKAYQCGSPEFDNFHNFSYLRNGNILALSNYKTSQDFLNGNFYYSKGEMDISLAEFDRNLNLLKTSSYGSSGPDYAINSSTDDNDNFYISGIFGGQMDLGNNINIKPVGSSNGYIAKFDRNSICQWAKTVPSPNSKMCHTTTKDGFSYVAGSFNKNVDLGNGIVLNSKGEQLFIAGYDANGNCQWAFNGTSDDATSLSYPIRITYDSDNNLYVTGLFKGIVDFGNGIRLSSNELQGFLLKLTPGASCSDDN